MLRWLIACAVAVPVLILTFLAYTSWLNAWIQAEAELRRSADAVGEYVLRILDGHRMVADRVNDLLQYHSNEQIQSNEASLHQQLVRLLPSLPLVQTIAVLRPDGLMLLTANVFPVPENSYFDDREWVRDLKKPDAPLVHISRVNVGRLDRNLFFGVSRRRLMANRSRGSELYDGVINISVQPNKVAAGFADLINETDDVVTVARSDGQILIRHPGFSEPMPPLSQEGSPEFFMHVAAGAARGHYTTTFRSDTKKRLVAYRRIEGFPVYASVARSYSAVMQQWQHAIFPQLAIGMPVTVMLAALGLYALRRSEEVERAEAAARFHAVFNTTPVGMAVLDSVAQTVVAANQALAELVNLPTEVLETGSWDFRQLLPAEDVAKFMLAPEAKGGGFLDTAVIVRERIPVRLTLSPLPGARRGMFWSYRI